MKVMGASALAAAGPSLVRAQTALAHVVVVGGGFAGATVAKYLRLWGGDQVHVTLVDPNPGHVSCILSNLVMIDRIALDDLTFGYGPLRRYGVNVVQGEVEAVEGSGPIVWLRDGSSIACDRIILAPGIAFHDVPGPVGQTPLHAWIAGPQTLALRDRLRTMPSDGTFILTIPPAPFRCPPGPYERACLVADTLLRRNRGRRRGGPKVIVLDANARIQAEEEVFRRAFQTLYDGVVTYEPSTQVEWADDGAGQVLTTNGRLYSGDVLNVIPPHRAAEVVAASGLTNDDGWAPVLPLTYESRLADNVHIVGDSQATGQPKSGHMANAQAKICVDAVLRSLELLPNAVADWLERADNTTTNSACYSPITRKKASWLTAVYRYTYDTDPFDGEMMLVEPSFGSSGGWSGDHFEDMLRAWWPNLSQDTFG